MAHILIMSSEMAGRINISLALSRRLIAAGHVVTLAGPTEMEDRATAHGAGFVPILRSNEAASAAERHGAGSGRAALTVATRLRQLHTIRERRKAAAEALDPDGLHAVVTRIDPDLVLVDIELPVPTMVAWGSGVPVALWTSLLSVWKRPGLPPLHTPIVPGTGWRGSRLGIEWAWLRFRAGKWLGNVRRRAMRVGADRISVLRTIAAQTGFPFSAEASLYDWLVPFTYRTFPVLSLNAGEFEFPHDPQPNCRYVGPVLDTERADADEHDGARALLADLYERRSNGISDALIYCSFGTWHEGDDAGFLNRVIEAAERHPEWDVIIGLGGRFPQGAFAPTPVNVSVLPWAPQLEVLGHADLAIHHGGISSINECIATGTPMVVYPFTFLDQRGNAARVAYHRLGEVGDRNSEMSEAISTRIERVLADDEVRHRVDNMQRNASVYAQQNRAVRAVEALL